MPVGLVWRGSSIACLSSIGAFGGFSEKETSVCRTGSGCFVADYPCRLLEGRWLEGRWPEGGKLQRVDAVRQLGNADDANTTGLAMLKRADVGDKQQAYAMSYRKISRLACSILSRTFNGYCTLELKKKS